MAPTVAVVRARSESVLDDVARVMDLADVRGALAPGATTIIKDNISWHYPFLSANTTPWQLEGSVQALRGAGFSDLVAVHNDTVVTDPYLGQRLCKLDRVYQRHEVPELYNCRDGDMEWICYTPSGEMLVLDRIFPEGIYVPDYFFGKNIVHLPTVKCHIYTTTTGAMKNAFGGLLNRRRHYAHTWIHETLVDLLTLQKEIHTGLFAVMDGTLAGDGPGPRTMRPVEKSVLLASADQVAIDAVAASMMGFDPLGIDYLRIAHDRGLGTADLRKIDIVGDPELAAERWGFRVGHNLASAVGSSLWRGPLSRYQKLFFHTPLVHMFAHASSVYHDRLWWPLKGRPAMARVARDSQWGRLFASY